MPKIWINLYRDLNACINIAHALMGGVGWGVVSSLNQQMRGRRKAYFKRWKPPPRGLGRSQEDSSLIMEIWSGLNGGEHV